MNFDRSWMDSLLAALLLLAVSIIKAAFALRSRSDVHDEQIKNLTADHEQLERDWTVSVKDASRKRGELYSRIGESETSMRQEDSGIADAYRHAPRYAY